MKSELSALSKIADTLMKNKIHFWMYGGALASYVKINDLFPWDGDIDIFIWEDDFHRLHKIRKQFGIPYVWKEFNLALRCGEGQKNVDIFYFGKEGNMATHEKTLPTRNIVGRGIYYKIIPWFVERGMIRATNFFTWLMRAIKVGYKIRQEVPLNYFEDLKEIDLFGVRLNVPKDHEGFMDYSYGPYWRLPIEEQEKEYDRTGKCDPRYYQVIK